jgi:signal transduction histidine kinase
MRTISRTRTFLVVVTVAGIAAGGTLLAALAVGMRGTELAHLATMLVPAVLVTGVSAAAAGWLLERSPIRQRLLAVAIVSAVVALANLAVMAALMLVKHDALLIAVLVVYSTGAGTAAALVTARSLTRGVENLVAAAENMAEGDLNTRIGKVGGGPELERLASSLDEMVSRWASSMKREQDAVQIRNDLITAVSHDLRTPLAGLRAMVESIEDGVVEDNETIRRYFVEMGRAVDALVVLVDDLFELVQLEAGAIEASQEKARLDEIVESALAACRPQAIERGLQVETHLSGAEGVLASPPLQRVVQNLLQNAIRHTPSDGTVWLRASNDNGVLCLAVEDNGEGIPAHQLERVFEPFWRGDAARSERGSGLGLALARRIVETLGGEIQVSSVQKEGSKFEVLLPA